MATPAPAPHKSAPAEAVRTAPPESAPVTASPVTSAPVPAASSAQPAGTSQAISAPQAPAAATTGATAESGGEADKGTLEQYRLALILATRRYKRYPAIAMENGWQGRVVVHMVIGANGMVASASIKVSSGHEILDNQAMDMLKKGKTTVPIPAILRGREFNIDVPVIFKLDSS
ncbi:MAG: energy transducer TonB [Burkholderiales bacterium]